MTSSLKHPLRLEGTDHSQATGQNRIARDTLSEGDEFGNLAVDAVVDILVGSIDFHDAAMIDQLFDNERRHIEADEVRARHQGTDVGKVELDVEFFRRQQGFQAEMELALQLIFARCFHQSLFDQLGGDSVTQEIEVLAQEIHRGVALGLLFMIQPRDDGGLSSVGTILSGHSAFLSMLGKLPGRFKGLWQLPGVTRRDPRKEPS